MTTINSTLLDIARDHVGVSHIDALEVAVNDVFERILDADPDPIDDDTGREYTVADYLADPAEQFVATRAVSGTPLPQNSATAKALLGAVEYLEGFYDAELKPLPARR